jgi:ATP-dependent Clp protease protease subunit
LRKLRIVTRLFWPQTLNPACPSKRTTPKQKTNQRIGVTSVDARPPVVCSQGPPPPNPLVVERFQSVVSQLFQQRIVRMGGPVDDDMANLVVAQLLYLDSADPNRDVTMYVNSPGGSVTAGALI